MTARNNLKIAVISDLHCKHSKSEDKTVSTLLYSDDIAGSITTNPYLALKELIKSNELVSDETTDKPVGSA